MAIGSFKIIAGQNSGKSGYLDDQKRAFYRANFLEMLLGLEHLIATYRDIQEIDAIGEETQQKSGAGGAVAGGLLFGGVGLVAGGLMGRKQLKKQTVGILFKNGTRMVGTIDEKIYTAMLQDMYEAKHSDIVEPIKNVVKAQPAEVKPLKFRIWDRVKLFFAGIGIFIIFFIIVGIIIETSKT